MFQMCQRHNTCMYDFRQPSLDSSIKINRIPSRGVSQSRVIRCSFSFQIFLQMCHFLLHFAIQHEQRDWDRVKRDICSLLGVTILLGITWGLVFFSFGSLTHVGLYPFCILNSLQGLHSLAQIGYIKQIIHTFRGVCTIVTLVLFVTLLFRSFSFRFLHLPVVCDVFAKDKKLS